MEVHAKISLILVFLFLRV